MNRRGWLLAASGAICTSCGYHVSGHADLLPRSLKTIAIPSWSNATAKFRLTDRLPQALTREFIGRTRYTVLNDPSKADMILTGSVQNFMAFPTTFDTATGRAAGVQLMVFLRCTLTERTTGKVLYTNPNFEIRERYEIATDQIAYFEESEGALNRVSKQVAAAIVSAILEGF